ncbi:MAG: proton-conducting transporter membrane subunit [Byssovorax sp.]
MSPLIVAAVGLLLLAAIGARRQTARRARHLGRGASAVAFRHGIGSLGIGSGRLGTGTDGVGALGVFLGLVVPLAFLSASSNVELEPARVSGLLGIEAGAILALSGHAVLPVALGHGIFVVAASLSFARVGNQAAVPKVRRAHTVYLVLGSAPMLLGFAVLTRMAFREHAPELLRLDGAGPVGISPGWRAALCLGFALTALTRMACLPFHSWLPLVTDSGPVGAVVSLLSLQLGLHVMTRLVLPFSGADASTALSALVAGGLVTSIYGALGALGQTSLRRAVAFVLLSQAGLTLVGVSSPNLISSTGGVLYGAASVLGFTGLLLAVSALEARVGRVTVTQNGGAARTAPRLSALYILLSLAAAGFPGSLGFVAEDLITQGIVDGHPFVATVMLVATAINGFVLLRGGFMAFFGRADAGFTAPPDVLPREGRVLTSILAAMVLAGLFPQSLLGLRKEIPGSGARTGETHEAAAPLHIARSP